MKKSQLLQIIREAIGGYEKKDGKLVPHSDKFNSTKLSSILTAIAKGRPEEESEEQPEDIQEDSDTTRAKDLGTLRGALMHVQALLNAERPHNEILAFVEKSLQQTKASDPLSEGEQNLYSKEDAINYIKNNPPAKYYKIGVSKSSSQQARSIEDAINIVDQSPISQFELSTYGQVIQFSAPFDAGHAASVRGMGGLD